MIQILGLLALISAVLLLAWIRHVLLGMEYGPKNTHLLSFSLLGKRFEVFLTQTWLWRKSRASKWIMKSLDCQSDHSWARQVWGVKYGWGVFIVEIWPE